MTSAVATSTQKPAKKKSRWLLPWTVGFQRSWLGRDLVAGIPKTVTISSKQVQEALADTINTIVDSVKLCLEQTPPELSADILDRGILMSGGGSMLRGLDERLRRETNLPVILSEEPLLAVVRGTGKVLEDLNRYRKVLTHIRRY